MDSEHTQTLVVRKLFIGLVATAILAASAVSLLRVRSVLSSAKSPAPVLFDHGLTALNPRQIPSMWTNESCGKCHEAAYEQWKRSRHYVAATNDNFRAQVLYPGGGREQWCINCHAPINPGASNLPTQKPEGLDELFESQPPWLVNGVDCLACHVRDGKVLVTRATEKAAKAHPIRVAPELGTAEFCGGCHQFNHPNKIFPDHFGGQLQQASLEEFLEIQAEARCHDCHMPDGDHHMPGGYDKRMLREELSLDLSAQWKHDLQAALVSADVSVGHVGHRVPGGEHFFRYLTLRTVVEDENGVVISSSRTIDSAPGPDNRKVVRQWPQVEFFGHKMGVYEEHRVGEPNPDSRLKPGESRPVRYLVPVDSAQIGSVARVRAELWYHVLDEEEAKKFGLSVEDTRWIIVSREIQIRLGGDK